MYTFRAGALDPFFGRSPGVGSGDLTRGRGQDGAEAGPGRTSGEGGERAISLGAAMATVDLEKLRMCGAGKAIGVLTSGGDAQGRRGAGPGAGRRAGASTCPGAPPRAPATLPGTWGQRLPVSARGLRSPILPDAPGRPRTCRAPRLPRSAPSLARPPEVCPRAGVARGHCARAGAGLAAGAPPADLETPAPLPGGTFPETCFPEGRAELCRSPRTLRAGLFLVPAARLGDISIPPTKASRAALTPAPLPAHSLPIHPSIRAGRGGWHAYTEQLLTLL